MAAALRGAEAPDERDVADLLPVAAEYEEAARGVEALPAGFWRPVGG